MVFYAVANGKNIGIFLNWNDCNNSVKGYKNAIYKKFDTKEDADNFIKNNNKSIDKTIQTTDNNGIKQKHITSFFNTVNTIQKEDNNSFEPDYYVYTDGACSNNGKDNAKAGIGIFFGVDDKRNVSKSIDGKQTNNTAELTALIETFNIIKNDIKNNKRIIIFSDSMYAIRCVTSYGEKCYNKNWEVDIPNKELVKIAYELYKDKLNIQLVYIKAHTNKTDIHSFGNDNADRLAKLAIS